MFGVVPKPLWEKATPADTANRIELETNCLLIDTPTQKILVDTGYGSKLPAKQLQHIDGEPGNPIVRNLKAAGIEPGEIDIVVFSHLHFDHASGASEMVDDKLMPVFPNARHVIQRVEWEDATSGAPELRGSYETEELRALGQSGLLELVDDDHEICAGISLHRTGGHTVGHQIVKVDSNGDRAAYLGDICPTVAHLKTFWIMAYDLFPREVRKMKPVIFQSLIDEEAILLFDHDPNMQGARIAQDESDRIFVKEKIFLK